MECASSDSKNRAAAGFIQRFQNTAMCSTGLGASPQQAEKPFVPRKRNGWFFAFVHTDALLATICLTPQAAQESSVAGDSYLSYNERIIGLSGHCLS